VTLHLHRSERADPLVRALAEVLREPLADPFTAEVVSVPARGVERWLVQQLSHHLGTASDGRDGVCANLEFPFPSVLVAAALAAASDLDPTADPWGERSVWTLIEVIDNCVDEEWCAPLARHLSRGGAAPAQSDRRFATAQHLAGLYSSYAQQRPAMLRDWVAGDDTDGAGAQLADDLRWQAELWRRLRTAIGTPGPAERHNDACAALRADPTLADLPARLSLFGPTRLSIEQVTVLEALAEHRDVHLWLPHPSAALWDKVRTNAPQGQQRRREDVTAGLPAHRLLASLGRDAREMQLALTVWSSVGTDQHHPLADPADDSLLHWLQHALRTDTAPERAPLGEHDRSLQVHACHGRTRQVEVLREVLLGLLQADHTLEPRDVLVMCPDIESYAPLISATFGLGDGAEPGGQPAHPGHRLRVRLADRSLRQTNPLLAVVSRLLELADARVTASEVLGLAGLQPVRRRFRFDDEDLDRVRDWVSTSGVRWGLDAAHRAPYGLDGVAQNTWRAGLDRILLGAAMSEDERGWLGSALPLDDVDSTDIDLAGRLAELVDRLTTALDQLRDNQPLDAWLHGLTSSLDTLTSVAERDGWQLTQARRELTEVATAAGDVAARTTLRIADVRALLADRLRGRPTRAGFRTGNLTICSMVPMRSVPHRVVCLLGLDDGVFPRSGATDGDDVLARDPLVGERDPRSEDRQLLLDAILAAQEHLVVLYTGADERTNLPMPPAVPLGELLDVVDATVEQQDGDRAFDSARDRVVTQHPLQPFDPRNFTADAPFSFDRAALAGARGAVAPRQDARPFLDRMPDAPGAPTGDVELDDLLRFLGHPVQYFLRKRLGVAVRDEDNDVLDALSIDLKGLDRWRVGDRWVSARLAGVGADVVRDSERRRGELPPGEFGELALSGVGAEAEPIADKGLDALVGDPGAVDVAGSLPSGCTVRGTVTRVYGDTVRRTEFSRLAPKHRLRAWTQILTLAAADDGRAWRAVTIGRGDKEAPACSRLTAPSAQQAGELLDELVLLYGFAVRQPLPMVADASCAYARARADDKTAKQSLVTATRAWKKSFTGDGDKHHQLVWGETPDFDVLLAKPSTPVPIEPTADDPTWFGALAQAVWQPLLQHEELT